jgi:threonine dehydrogenase-like Zn-dependent dehydrogenase
MRALQFHDALDVRIDEVDPPGGPLTGSDVLVRSVLCGICGTDLHEYRIGPLLTSVQPKILGHEVAAVVLDTGPDVTSLQAGDRVAIMPQVYCGRCGACRITLRGSFIYPVDCWPRVIRMIESGRFPVEELITTTLPLESAVGAFESLVDPQSADVKVVVQVTEV